MQFSLSSELASTPANLVLHVGTQEYHFSDAAYNAGTFAYGWADNVPTWAESDSVAVKITGPPPPNAYGYRTIWTALMTAGDLTGSVNFGYDKANDTGKLSADTIVLGRTDRGVIDDKFRYPWNGYEILTLTHGTTDTDLSFDSQSYPSADEVAGWTLVVDGKELPFAGATNPHASLPNVWNFTYAPNPAWTDRQQLLVSIRTKDVQNRVGRVVFKASDAFHDGKVHHVSRKRPAGSSYILAGTLGRQDPSGANFSVPGHTFSLEFFQVIRKGTDDEDPVWITATFRAPNEDMSWTGYWEGEFEQFHTLFLRWYDNINKRPSTYTLPLRSAAPRAAYSGRAATFHLYGSEPIKSSSEGASH